MEEQAGRADADEAHVARPRPGWRSSASSTATCRVVCELLDDLFAGRKRLKVYRQFKMYNDPTMNPYLYAARRPAA